MKTVMHMREESTEQRKRKKEKDGNRRGPWIYEREKGTRQRKEKRDGKYRLETTQGGGGIMRRKHPYHKQIQTQPQTCRGKVAFPACPDPMRHALYVLGCFSVTTLLVFGYFFLLIDFQPFRG